MEPLKRCVLCNNWTIDPPIQVDSKMVYRYHCIQCGDINIDFVTERDIRNEERKAKSILSGYTRELTERGIEYEIRVSPDINLSDYLLQISYPKSLTEKMDKVMDYLELKSEFYGEQIVMDESKNQSLSYSTNVQEHIFIMNQLSLKGWIEKTEGKQRITAEGWQYLDNRRRSGARSKNVFVATWFDEKMDSAVAEMIKAIGDSGYNAVWLKTEKHNEMIDDRIIAELRKCKFAICDLTGHRNSVYFEAGFAKGLNVPVIWMCRDDYKDDLAFDTRQFFHILWVNEDTIYQQLKDHIEATIFP